VRAHNNRAYILAKLERYAEAVEDYTMVLRYDPRSVHAYHNRGISYDKLGLIDLAIADFTKVCYCTRSVIRRTIKF
jgi:tetratricopeptide (TPR) repeat protein